MKYLPLKLRMQSSFLTLWDYNSLSHIHQRKGGIKIQRCRALDIQNTPMLQICEYIPLKDCFFSNEYCLYLPGKLNPSKGKTPLGRKLGTWRWAACPLAVEVGGAGKARPFMFLRALSSRPDWAATSFHSCWISAGDIMPGTYHHSRADWPLIMPLYSLHPHSLI